MLNAQRNVGFCLVKCRVTLYDASASSRLRPTSLFSFNNKEHQECLWDFFWVPSHKGKSKEHTCT